jgi:lipoyl(octanoyl) transferase
MSELIFQDWGLIDYKQALEKQLALVEDVAAQMSKGYLIFCSHPPVVTLGRKTQQGDITSWDGPVIEISRGGRATYHGPSQLVVYPIYNLDFDGKKDIHAYLRKLEQAIVETLKHYRVEAIGKSLQEKSITEKDEETGVWVGRQKIASLGIAVKKWVSFHGAAINLDEDPRAFVGMKPCGFSSDVMISLEKLSGQKINRPEFSQLLKEKLMTVL